MEPQQLSLFLINKINFRVKDQYAYRYFAPVSAFVIMVFTIIILSSLYRIFDLGSYGLLVALILISIQIFISYRFNKYRNERAYIPPQAHTQDTISFENDGLHIKKVDQQQNIELQSIDSITLYSSMYEGYTSREFNSKIQQYYSGQTVIQIDLKDGTTCKYFFLLGSEHDMIKTTHHLKHWYRSGIRVKEYTAPHDDLAVLFRTDWSYNEYQELKEKLGVERFY